MTKIKKLLFILCLAPLLVYVSIIVFLYFKQEKLIFPASKLSADHQFTFHLPFKEVNIPVDGATLNALHFKQENPKGVVFFLHGNAGSLETWTSGVDFYKRNNYDLFIFDYRGYGKSTGKIQSEEQLHSDIKAAWNFLGSQYKNKRKVIYGRSLGTSLAVKLAEQVDSDLLVLVSPFISMKKMAQLHYPFIPTSVLRYPLRTDKTISKIKTPTLFMHGDKDRTTPLSHSQELMALMTNKPRLIIIQGAAHNNVHQFDQYLNNLAAALPD